mmetsp:Transcript_95290/g.218261  ORF Transcript_95290/g.218261 Transcript_95290/m.218261 type:complete len:319 (+) Transcript_95290:33-989(+)
MGLEWASPEALLCITGLSVDTSSLDYSPSSSRRWDLTCPDSRYRAVRGPPRRFASMGRLVVYEDKLLETLMWTTGLSCMVDSGVSGLESWSSFFSTSWGSLGFFGMGGPAWRRSWDCSRRSFLMRSNSTRSNCCAPYFTTLGLYCRQAILNPFSTVVALPAQLRHLSSTTTTSGSFLPAVGFLGVAWPMGSSLYALRAMDFLSSSSCSSTQDCTLLHSTSTLRTEARCSTERLTSSELSNTVPSRLRTDLTSKSVLARSRFRFRATSSTSMRIWTVMASKWSRVVVIAASSCPTAERISVAMAMTSPRIRPACWSSDW